MCRLLRMLIAVILALTGTTQTLFTTAHAYDEMAFALVGQGRFNAEEAGAAQLLDTSGVSAPQRVLARGTSTTPHARSVATNSSDVLLNSSKQLQKKFNRASDFGVTGNYSKANATKYSEALNQHINSPGVTKIPGTYRGDPVTHYLNTSTGLNVIVDPGGVFVSGWKLGPGANSERTESWRSHMSDEIAISLSSDSALVLLALISRLNEGDQVEFDDQAEQRVLWDLESVLEAAVAATVASDYLDRLRLARDRVRDVDQDTRPLNTPTQTLWCIRGGRTQRQMGPPSSPPSESGAGTAIALPCSATAEKPQAVGSSTGCSSLRQT
jgi:Colicin D